MTHTKDLLADELEKIGLREMAEKARTGYYHDFLSPLDLPTMQLVNDLFLAKSPDAMKLRERVIEGEFDATREESEDWARSAEGQDAIHRLVGRHRK